MDWRDQHRKEGRFHPRPGAKGFVPSEPRESKPPTERRPFSLWVEKTRAEPEPPKK